MSANDRRLICLVGSTGAGKSCLGNFLVDPVKATTDEDVQQDFKTSGGGPKQTIAISNPVPVQGFPTLYVVDTPGFDETPMKDAEHAVELLKALKRYQKIAAVVFVYQGRTENNFASLVKYVRALFTEGVLALNLIVVRSHVHLSRTAEIQRRRQKETIESLLEEARATAVSEFGVNPVFVTDIDAFPSTEIRSELDAALARRQAILRAVCNTEPVRVQNLRFPKLPWMVEKDELAIVALLEKKKQLELAKSIQSDAEKMVLREIQEKDAAMGRLRRRLQSKQDRLADVDTDQKIWTGSNQAKGYPNWWWSDHDGCVKIQVQGQHPIIRDTGGVVVNKLPGCDGDSVDIKFVRNDLVEVCITPESYLGKTGAFVTCYSYKRVVNAALILSLKEDVEHLESEVSDTARSLAVLESQSSSIRSAYQQGILREMRAAEAESLKLSSRYMDVDEVLNSDYLRGMAVQ